MFLFVYYIRSILENLERVWFDIEANRFDLHIDSGRSCRFAIMFNSIAYNILQTANLFPRINC